MNRMVARFDCRVSSSFPRVARYFARWTLLTTALLGVICPTSGRAEDATAVEKRLGDAIKLLAADEMEGRGIGTKGIDAAADYIAREFKNIGLKTDLFGNEPFQKFKLTASVEPGAAEKNTLQLERQGEKPGEGAKKTPLKLGQDFSTLAVGGSGTFDAPLVFAGYGITAKSVKQKNKDLAYDDYAGLDVKGKAVIILRKEPQQGDPHSAFGGSSPSHHAHFSSKISNAIEHGVAAIVLINDCKEGPKQVETDKKAWQQAVDELADIHAKHKAIATPTPEQASDYRKKITQAAEKIETLGKKLDGSYDGLLRFSEAGMDSAGKPVPVYFATRAAIEPAVKAALGKDLAAIEQEIDADLTPRSAPLNNWRLSGSAEVVRKQADVKNVIGVLEGEGPHADETIVVGAHYDHLGYGDSGSLAAPHGSPLGNWTRAIHNGADDNASGVVTMLEIAREIAATGKKLPRRLVFIAFTGEERGLLGSAHYVREPRFPLEKTVAMVNLDMVGRLRDDKLLVYGTGTASEFDKLVDDLNQKHHFKLVKKPEGFGPSDQTSFYTRKIPVFHLFTDTHKEYHRPTDKPETIVVPGMRRVGAFAADIILALAAAPEPPHYKEVSGAFTQKGGDRPYFGSIPDFGQEGSGYGISGVAPGSPAEKAGVKAGDLIVQLGETKVTNLDDFDSALRKHKPGEKVPLLVKRGKETVTLQVVLDPPR